MSFWQNNGKYENDIALFDEESERTVTYIDLYQEVDEISNHLLSSDKKLVLLLTDNSFASIALYLGCFNADAALMMLDLKIDFSLLENIVKTYNPDIILSAHRINSDLGHIKKVTAKTFDYHEIKFQKTTERIIYPGLSLLLPTSGSTGSSKFVKLTKENIYQNARSIVQYLNIDSEQVAVTTLPINYSFGLSIINSHLLAGAKIVCTNRSVIEKKFWEIFRFYKSTTFSGVPYTYQILEKFHFNRLDFPFLRYFTQAGGDLNSQTKMYFLNYAKDQNKKFYVMYGQTEATARISYVPADKLEEKLDSIGIAIPGGKLKVFDKNKEINEPGHIGEIVYSGPNVMLGYATDSESLANGDENNGILRTGDLGKFDRDGFFYLTGRLKRFLKVFGNRVNLDDFERMLEINFKSPFAVSGIDDNVYILSENFDNKKLVAKFLSQKLNINFSAFKFLSIDKLPVTGSGKKDYALIKELFKNIK